MSKKHKDPRQGYNTLETLKPSKSSSYRVIRKGTAGKANTVNGREVKEPSQEKKKEKGDAL